MAQKLVAKPGALGSAFDQPGDVGNDKTAVVVNAYDPRLGCSVVKG